MFNVPRTPLFTVRDGRLSADQVTTVLRGGRRHAVTPEKRTCLAGSGNAHAGCFTICVALSGIVCVSTVPSAVFDQRERSCVRVCLASYDLRLR